MEKFNCKICGEDHAVFQAIDVPIPELILNIEEDERKKRVVAIQDSYILDDQILFLKGDIFIYKKNQNKPFFNWSVLVSISLSTYKAKAEELQQRKNVTFDGHLETELPFYKQQRGTKVKAVINLDYDYAIIKIEEESPLKDDQSTAITEARVIEIMERYYHHAKKSH